MHAQIKNLLFLLRLGIVVIFICAVDALTAASPPLKPSPLARSGEVPAVVLVHGIFHSGRSMAWLERRCAEVGYESFAPTLKPANGKTELTELSDQLHQMIQQRFGSKRRLHVMGFSMGGLVSRHWLTHHADLNQIVSFTTIGSPHEGTAIAWFSNAAGIKDMRPDSPFLTALAQDDAKLAILRPLSIYTPLDVIILPPQSADWPTAATVTPVPVASHVLLPRSPLVFATMLNYWHEQESHSVKRHISAVRNATR